MVLKYHGYSVFWSLIVFTAHVRGLTYVEFWYLLGYTVGQFWYLLGYTVGQFWY